LSALIRAELLKLRTTRTTWVLLGTAMLIVLSVLVLVLALFDHGGQVSGDDLGALFSFTAIADLLVLSLGIVGAAGEFRHGTVTAAFLVTPARWPVIVAKAIAYALVGMVYALATLLLCAALALPWLAIKDANFDVGGDAWILAIAGRCLYGAFIAALGVGIGMLVRNQAAALVAALVFLLAIEPALGAVSGAVATYGLNGAALSIFGASDTGIADVLPFGAGVALYLGYVLLFLGAGTVLTLRRDVS
jgi:ABC-2 type transport system permease protein